MSFQRVVSKRSSDSGRVSGKDTTLQKQLLKLHVFSPHRNIDEKGEHHEVQ